MAGLHAHITQWRLWARKRFALSPMNRRRWENFQANKRGLWSLRIVVALFAVSLFAEFIANDKPILVYYDGALLSPAVAFYPETRFGGTFVAEADYRDPFVRERIAEKGWAIWPLIPYHYDTIVRTKTVSAPAAPDGQNWLGTDDHQRDLLARVIYGFRTSVVFALLLTGLSSVIGVSAGAVQGYFGAWLDLVAQR